MRHWITASNFYHKKLRNEKNYGKDSVLHCIRLKLQYSSSKHWFMKWSTKLMWCQSFRWTAKASCSGKLELFKLIFKMFWNALTVLLRNRYFHFMMDIIHVICMYEHHVAGLLSAWDGCLIHCKKWKNTWLMFSFIISKIPHW